MREQIKILDLYLGRCTILGFLMVLSILVVLFSFLELLIQINDVGKGSYRLADAFLYMALTTPKRMVDLMPVAALLGSIVALGLLADHQELTAMQAAGMSIRRIAFSVLGTSIVLMLATILMAEFIAPPLDQQARFRRSKAIYGKPVMLSKAGFWVRHGQSFVNVGRIFSADRAGDVEVYELDEAGRLRQFIFAQEALIEERNDWRLSHVYAKVFSENGVAVNPMTEYHLKAFLTPNEMAVLELPADSLSLSDLWAYIRSLDQRGENSEAYSLAFWQKICLPITTSILVLLSLTFIFGSTRIRNAAQRIFAGMLTGVVFYLANQIIGHLGLIFDLPALLTTLAPVGVILILALRLLKRAF